MKTSIILLTIAFFASAPFTIAQDKVLPEGMTKDQAALMQSIEENASQILSSEAVAALSKPKQRIKVTFDKLIKAYGVKHHFVIAKAMGNLVPEELHGYVAKRALSYSPLKAKELLASLSKNGANGSVRSALSVLPGRNVHTAAAASAAGVAPQQPIRTFQLPQVDTRRRVASTVDNGRLVFASGQIDLDGPGGNPPVNAEATLKGVVDNGFTLDGLGYIIVADGNILIGEYLAIEEDENSPGTLNFFFKNIVPDPNNELNQGNGPLFKVTMTDV